MYIDLYQKKKNYYLLFWRVDGELDFPLPKDVPNEIVISPMVLQIFFR